MNKIAIYIAFALMLVASAAATLGPSCSNGATLVAGNPEQSIVVCDDPTDSTCEQNFTTLCPTDWHLCSAAEYNAGNDNWAGSVPNWLLGEIQCRFSGDDSGFVSGAGHFTVTSGTFNAWVENNKIAGSSLPECQSDYGCNEKQYYALCCYGVDMGDDDNGGYEVVDTDSDGVADSQDNCPSVANADQIDLDQDGIGDACDESVDIGGDDEIPEFGVIGASIALIAALGTIIVLRKNN
jgi:hypothetical protein